jgi:hypothetical protein
MAQNPKDIFPATDVIFPHNGKNIVVGWRGNKADNDFALIGGLQLSNLQFDAQIWLNFGADGFGDGSDAGIRAGMAGPIGLFNQKLFQVYGTPSGGGTPTDPFDALLLKVQQFLKANLVYDAAVGVKLK